MTQKYWFLNLSANQLRGVDVESVEQMLAEAGLDAWRLALDVTETALLQTKEEGVGVLARLREMGVKIFIDGFGTAAPPSPTSRTCPRTS